MSVALFTSAEISQIVKGATKAAADLIQAPQQATEPCLWEWLPNSEAIRLLGLSKASLQRYRSSGLLPHSKMGGNIFYRKSDLESILERNLRIGTTVEAAQ